MIRTNFRFYSQLAKGYLKKMNKKLTRCKNELYYYENGVKIIGVHSKITDIDRQN